MPQLDEGYIKFQLSWEQRPIDPACVPAELMQARDRLHQLGLVGVYADSGIGYGNVSARLDSGGLFVISGSATGAIPESEPRIFSVVDGFDIARNSVACHGEFPASSESLTHAMFYACDPAIRFVLHVHHADLWKRLLGIEPTSSPNVAYGTPEMAEEVLRLYQEGDLSTANFMVMGGHPEGLVAFGSTAGAAMGIIEARC